MFEGKGALWLFTSIRRLCLTDIEVLRALVTLRSRVLNASFNDKYEQYSSSILNKGPQTLFPFTLVMWEVVGYDGDGTGELKYSVMPKWPVEGLRLGPWENDPLSLSPSNCRSMKKAVHCPPVGAGMVATQVSDPGPVSCTSLPTHTTAKLAQ